MMLIAVDPGPIRSAYLIYGSWQPLIPAPTIVEFALLPNQDLLQKLTEYPADLLCIEQVESFGMAVGAEVFDTVFWSGRFAQAFRGPFARVTRREVKLHLCKTMRATDANIRQALIDHFGGDSVALDGKRCPKAKNKSHGAFCAICGGTGWERPAGPLAGMRGDVWSALAVAVTYWETRKEKEGPF